MVEIETQPQPVVAVLKYQAIDLACGYYSRPSDEDWLTGPSDWLGHSTVTLHGLESTLHFCDNHWDVRRAYPDLNCNGNVLGMRARQQSS